MKKFPCINGPFCMETVPCMQGKNISIDTRDPFVPFIQGKFASSTYMEPPSQHDIFAVWNISHQSLENLRLGIFVWDENTKLAFYAVSFIFQEFLQPFLFSRIK